MFKSKEIRGPATGRQALRRRRRPRGGVRDLATVDVLSLALGGVPQSLNVAAALLERHGTLGAMARCEPEELALVKGLGPVAAERLGAAFELGARAVSADVAPGTIVRGPDDLRDVLLEEFRRRDRERFLALHLDTRHRIRDVETVSVGSLNASLVHPREVFRSAVRRGTAALVVAHNHPSGCAEPSREDLELTVRLSECGRLMGIELLDHLIVGSGRITSLRERGWPGRDDARPKAADAQEG